VLNCEAQKVAKSRTAICSYSGNKKTELQHIRIVHVDIKKATVFARHWLLFFIKYWRKHNQDKHEENITPSIGKTLLEFATT